MGFFNKLFDKRKQLAYKDACDYLFTFPFILKIRYTKEFSDISEYTADLLGITAAYVDTKPKESYIIGSSMGSDMFRYCGNMLLVKPTDEFLSKCKEKHSFYSNFIATKMGNMLNTTTIRALAEEVCRVYNIEPDSHRINTIVADIDLQITAVNSLFSEYRIV